MQHIIEHQISLTRVLDGLTEEQAREYADADKAYLTRVLSSGATRHLDIDSKFFQLDGEDAEIEPREIADEECGSCQIDVDEDGDSIQRVECQTCFVQTDGCYSKDEVKRLWNRRA